MGVLEYWLLWYHSFAVGGGGITGKSASAPASRTSSKNTVRELRAGAGTSAMFYRYLYGTGTMKNGHGCYKYRTCNSAVPITHT